MAKRNLPTGWWKRNNVKYSAIPILLTIIGLGLQYWDIILSNENESTKVVLLDTLRADAKKLKSNTLPMQDNILYDSRKVNVPPKNKVTSIITPVNTGSCEEDIDTVMFHLAKELFEKIKMYELKPRTGSKILLMIDDFTDLENYLIEGSYYSLKFQQELAKVINSDYKLLTRCFHCGDVNINGQIYYSPFCSDIVISAELEEGHGEVIAVASKKAKIEQTHVDTNHMIVF